MKKVAIMFPGQGSQVVGKGKGFFDQYEEVQRLYKTANVVLHKDIQNIMFDGPTEELTETENTQPALLLSSIAAYTSLMKENVTPVMRAAHRLGHNTALV